MIFKIAQEKVEQKKKELEQERREIPQRLTEIEKKILEYWVNDVPLETIAHYVNLDKKIVLDIIMQNENIWMRMIIDKIVDKKFDENNKLKDEQIKEKVKTALLYINKISNLLTKYGDK